MTVEATEDMDETLKLRGLQVLMVISQNQTIDCFAQADLEMLLKVSRLSKIMQKITAQFDVTEFWKSVIRSVLTLKIGALLKSLEKIMSKNVSLKSFRGMVEEVLEFDLDDLCM